MRHLTQSILFGVLLLLLVGGCTAEAASSNLPPNILLIVSDDQGWNDYGFMGHPQIATPRLDRLATQSLTFQWGYTPVPLCRPSLATMLTGLYPHQHGVTGNDPELPEKGVGPQTQRGNPQYARYYETIIRNFARQPNLVRDLTARGYVSLQTGKWWEGDPVKVAGFSQAMTVGTNRVDRHGGAGLSIGRDGLSPITEFIEHAGNKPWLVWYAPMLPHAPHTPPKDLLEKYRRLTPSESVARYWACVEWLDRTCGELLDYLDAKKLRENTIIIYVCDNGWIPKPAQVNKHEPRSKNTPYEGGVRTPIMISWPGKLPPRMDNEHLASTIDLWPTLAALLGTGVPKGLPGIDLTDTRAVTNRTAIYGEQLAHNIADVDKPTRSLEYRWVIADRLKLILPNPRNRPNAKPELYELIKDPSEQNDLADSQPDQVKRLSKQIDDWWSPGK